MNEQELSRVFWQCLAQPFERGQWHGNDLHPSFRLSENEEAEESRMRRHSGRIGFNEDGRVLCELQQGHAVLQNVFWMDEIIVSEEEVIQC